MNNKKNEIKMIAVDMDGTLLTSEKTILPETIRDIEAAAAAGIEVVYCSGRGIRELEEYIPLLPDVRYAVGMNGSLVYDIKERRPIILKTIPLSVVYENLKTAEEFGGMTHFMTETESIVPADKITNMAAYNMGQYQEMFSALARHVPDMWAEAETHPEGIPKNNIFFRSAEDRKRAHEMIKDRPLSFAYTEESSLEMTAEGVNKGTGILSLAEHLGFSADEIMGIGDSDNDRQFLDVVGLSVAMGNSEEAILALCDVTTADNDHNGVGEAIRKYALS